MTEPTGTIRPGEIVSIGSILARDAAEHFDREARRGPAPAVIEVDFSLMEAEPDPIPLVRRR